MSGFGKMGRGVKKEMENDDWMADAPMPDDELSNCRLQSRSKEFTSFLSNYGLHQAPAPIQTFSTHAPHQVGEGSSSCNPSSSSLASFFATNRESPYNTPGKNVSINSKNDPKDSNEPEDSNEPQFMDSSEKVERAVPMLPDEIDTYDICERDLIPESVEANTTSHWATVFYYEQNERVGAPFEVSDPIFYIDGSSDRQVERNRFSIAGTPVNTSWKSNTIRNQFGAGVQFCREDGSVTLKCLTDSPIFVQCPQVAELRGEVPNTIYRLQRSADQDSELAIFDEPYFERIMEKRRNFMNESFYMLHSHCITRISFVKGFGTDYPRQRITQTPCWVEVHMVHKLALFDEIVRNVHRNMNGLGSLS